MKTTVGAGVAVAVAGAIGIAHAATPAGNDAGALTGAPVAGAPVPQAPGAPQGGGSVVAHVVDARAGTIEIFTDGSRAQIHDADLAGRITRVGAGSPVVIHVVDAHAGTLDVFSPGTRTQIRNRDLADRIRRAA